VLKVTEWEKEKNRNEANVAPDMGIKSSYTKI
jgi:hypothetical protein